MLLQILTVLIAVIFLGRHILYFKSQKRGRIRTAFSIFLWMSVIFISSSPFSINNLSIYLGFGSSLNTFIFIGFIVVLAALLEVFIQLDKLSAKIETLVREDAIKSFKNKHDF